MAANLLEIAGRAVSLGLSIVPPRQDGSKAPVGPTWEQWQRERPTMSTLIGWYQTERRTGIGVVGGGVSGGLVTFEFDDQTGYPQLLAVASHVGLAELVERIAHGYSEITPSGGVHLLYYCPDAIGGNTKLARRRKRPGEMKDDHDVIKTIIETRGEGGYTVLAPSYGDVHPTGRPYQILYGSLETIVTITPDEQAMLFTLARTFDELTPLTPSRIESTPPPDTAGDYPEGRPGDQFNLTANWHDILEPHGWTAVYQRGDEIMWRRPGKTIGISATTNYQGSDLLYVFSSSTLFEPERGYRKFSAYTVLNHNGDFHAAASELAGQGYGSPREPLSGPTIEFSASADHSYGLLLTDVGNVERFVKQYAGKVRYCDELGWLFWDGMRWQRSTGHVERFAAHVTAGIWDEMQAMDWEKAGKEANREWHRFLRYSNSARGILALLTVAKSHIRIRSAWDSFDANPWFLNCENGVLDLQTGALRPHDPDLLITKLAPIMFDPRADCPTFERFLRQTFSGDDDLIQYVQAAIGYSATGVVQEHVLFFLHGRGRNGKSTLINLILQLLGDYALEAPVGLLETKQQEGHTTDIVDLLGTRMVSANETEEGRRMAESRVKALTGGDQLAGRKLYKDNIRFWPTHKLWLRGNHKPIIRGQDAGIWERVKLIPFLVQLAEHEQDGSLPLRLFAEASGVLNWILAGCTRWQKDGLKTPATVRIATSDYRSEMDVMAEFLDTCCEIGDLYSVTSADLFASYAAWMQGRQERPVSQKFFGMRLAERGYTQGRTGTSRFWAGLKLSPDAPTGRNGAIEWRRPYAN